jgi:hypothetical protein
MEQTAWKNWMKYLKILRRQQNVLSIIIMGVYWTGQGGTCPLDYPCLLYTYT